MGIGQWASSMGVMMCGGNGVNVIGGFDFLVKQKLSKVWVGLGLLVPATQAKVMMVFKIPSMYGQSDPRNCDKLPPIELIPICSADCEVVIISCMVLIDICIRICD